MSLLRPPADRDERGRGRSLLRLLGPAFVAAVAYVDPGNVAANVSAGAGYGYLLVWVLVLANAMAVVVQYLSAKLGVVTGMSLPEVLGARMRRPTRYLYWAQAELVAAATDLAEVLGGAIALQLLFGLPLLVGGLVVSLVSLALLAIQSRRSQRTFESVVIGMLGVITFGFVAGLFVAPVDWGGVTQGLLPRFDGPPTVLLAASMLGATVMPHAIYLHSALTTDRHAEDRARRGVRPLLRATKWDVALALMVAGSVNVAMLVLAAASLPGVEGADTIEGAAAAISANLGAGIGVLFAIGLLASGIASTSVGTYAGDVIMQGLLHRHIPILLRRAITLIPALVILGTGIDPTWALVLSQVLLSLGIPFALIPLVRYTAAHDVMGTAVNTRRLRVVAGAVTALIVTLNVGLVWAMLA